MPSGRLFLSPRKHPAFFRAIERRQCTKGRVRVPVVGRKKAFYLNKRDLSDTLRRLARSPAILEWVTVLGPDAVPPLIRRLAASGNGPRAYFVDGSLIERTFGVTSTPFVPAHGDSVLIWDTAQRHRIPREPETQKFLPYPAPRTLTSWQASVVVYCWAEKCAKGTKMPPSILYFFYRDWLMDQVKVTQVSNGLRALASRLLSWMCGSSIPELDECAAHAPARPPDRTEKRKRLRCTVVNAEMCHDSPRFIPTQPPTNDHRGRATCWTSVSTFSTPYAILKFDRSRVQPLNLWEALREVVEDDERRSFDIIFDAEHVYLHITHELWKRIMLERVPLMIASGSTRMTFARSRERPIAPFLAAAYLAGGANSTELAVRGLFALLFHKTVERVSGDERLLELVPSLLNRYPDVVARMRRAYREELAEGEYFRREEPGFFAGLYTMTQRNAIRGIAPQGRGRLRSSEIQKRLDECLSSQTASFVTPLVLLSEDQVYELYSEAMPEVLESLMCLTPGRFFPAKQLPIRLKRPKSLRRTSDAQRAHHDRQTEKLEPDGFVRALYEAERLVTKRVDDRDSPDGPEPEIELDQRALWDYELAPGVPAKRAFFSTAGSKNPSGATDPFYSAHEDAEACLRIHPITRVQVEAKWENHADMETTDLRSERCNSPFSLALEECLDDRSQGTRKYSEGWSVVRGLVRS